MAIDGSSVNINDIDVSTLELAGVGPPVRTSTNKDVIGDSALDLVAHFSIPDLNGAGVLNDGAILSLTGQLNDGTPIVGSDQIFLAGGPNCFDQAP